jgi:hypothetical protein
MATVNRTALLTCTLLTCIGALTACGEQAADVSRDSGQTTSATPSPQATQERRDEAVAEKAKRDPVFAAEARLREANKDHPQVRHSDAIADAFANRRTMMDECAHKKDDARKSCEQIADEVFKAARADASAMRKAAEETPSDEVTSSPSGG